MPANREKTRVKAVAAIEKLRGSLPMASVEHLDRALAAQALALSARDPLLEAEALILMGKTFAPAVNPSLVWSSLLRAQSIFEANGLEHRALTCRVAAAQVLFDIGEERSAISAAESVLANPRLEVEDRAFAHILIALCNSHLGELDTALRRLTQWAAPLASTCRETALTSQVMWARGLTCIRLMLYRRNPELFRGWPDMPPILEPLPSAPYVVSLFDQAQAAMPGGRPWPYLELGSLFARALSEESTEPLRALHGFSERYISSDPPLAARALFCIGVVSRQKADLSGALTVLEKAVALAEPLQATSIVRDVLLHISRIHEALGNSSLALAAFKRYSNFTLRSLLVPEGRRGFGFKEPIAAPERLPSGEREAPPSRNLEPAFLRNATSFISESLGTRISVNDVVEHCKVSRRTLETAFRRYKLRTVAQCIKQAKIEHASQHLLRTRLPVREIAASLGYASPAAFSQDFKAHFGKSPLKWREDPDYPAPIEDQDDDARASGAAHADRIHARNTDNG